MIMLRHYLDEMDRLNERLLILHGILEKMPSEIIDLLLSSVKPSQPSRNEEPGDSKETELLKAIVQAQVRVISRGRGR